MRKSRTNARYAWWIVALTVVIALPAPGAARTLAAGDAFVPLDAESIAGTRVILPTDAHGSRFVALFGFSRKAGDASERWSDALAKALPSGVEIYAVADLSGIPGIIRGFVVAAIRKQAAPLTSEQRNRLLLLTHKNAWSRIVPSGSDDDAVIVTVDQTGTIAAIERSPFSAAAVDKIVRTLP